MLNKGKFDVVGVTTVVKSATDKYDVLHLCGAALANAESTQGLVVCKAFVDIGRHAVGDVVTVLNHKGDYIVLD